MTGPNTTADEIIARTTRFNTLCRNVFGSGEGKELLQHLIDVHVYGALYQESDRATAYCVGQRDLVIELQDRLKPQPGEALPKLDGEEVS